MYPGNLLDRELSGQNGTGKTKTLQPPHFFRRTVISLSGGMKHKGGACGKFQKGHILYENGIHTSSFQIKKQLSGSLQFFIVKDGIDRDINLHPERTGIRTELSDIVDTVSCCSTCTKTGCTYIDGISTMVNGRDATFQILGRG